MPAQTSRLSVLARLPQPAFALDDGGHFVWLNPVAMRMLVPPGVNLLGRHYLERVHPDDREGSIQRYHRILRGELEAYQADVRYLDAQDETVWLRVSAVHTHASEIEGVALLVIAQVKSLEEIPHAGLVRSERQLRLALEASRAGVWDWDLLADLVEYSDSFKSLLRYSSTHGFHEAFTFRDRLHPHDRERALHAVQESIGRDKPFDEAYRLLCFDGQYRWFRGRGQTFHDEHGRAVRFCGVLFDWTDQHAFERRLQLAEERQRYLANHDELTGLMNRRAWLQNMSARLQELERKDRLALLLIDLDGFKDVNDSLGHHAGDQMLRELSRRMIRLLGPQGRLARLGGDEFVCSVEGPDAQQAAADWAELLIDALSRPWQSLQHHIVSVGASVGIALYPQHGRRAESLLRSADAALYAAKAAGRGTHRFYDRGLRRAARHRLRLETRLRRAIHERAFHVLYQPVRDCLTGELVGAEALLRWQDAELGAIGPQAFIPVAEALGLMPMIGRIMREHALAAWARWQEQGWKSAQLAINVSVRELMQQEFVEQLLAQLMLHGLPASGLMLEITESVLLEATTPSVLARLQAHGIRFAIDDFGLGYSSLARLRELEVDAIKIDRSFLQAIDDTERQDQRLCAAIIAMAHSLGIEVIAEGVERQSQWQALKVLDCDRYQGYLDGGEPMSAEALLVCWHTEQGRRLHPASRRQAS